MTPCTLLVASVVSLLEVPAFSGPVRDDAHAMSGADAALVAGELETLHRTGKLSMAVWIVPSLDGEPIEELAQRTFERWQLGKRGEDQGLLYLVAIGDRTARLEVGYGLEGTLTDAFTRRLQDDVVRPYFRAARYGEGVRAAVAGVARQLGLRLDAELPPPPREPADGFPPLLVILFLAPFVLVPLFVGLRKRLPERAWLPFAGLMAADVLALFWGMALYVDDAFFYFVLGAITAVMAANVAQAAVPARRPALRRAASVGAGAAVIVAALALVGTRVGPVELLLSTAGAVVLGVLVLVSLRWGGRGSRSSGDSSSRSSSGWSSSSRESSSSGSSFSGGGSSGGGGSTSRW